VKTGTPPPWPFRSRLPRESANAWVRSPQGARCPAEGQDREAAPAVCLVSRWEQRRSKEAYSVLAIGLRAAEWGYQVRPWPESWLKQVLRRLLRQPSEASGPYVDGCILSQTHFLSNLAQHAPNFRPRNSPHAKHKPVPICAFFALRDAGLKRLCREWASPRSGSDFLPLRASGHAHA
jgi:hypothetical protein